MFGGVTEGVEGKTEAVVELKVEVVGCLESIEPKYRTSLALQPEPSSTPLNRSHQPSISINTLPYTDTVDPVDSLKPPGVCNRFP